MGLGCRGWGGVGVNSAQDLFLHQRVHVCRLMQTRGGSILPEVEGVGERERERERRGLGEQKGGGGGAAVIHSSPI